MICDKGKINDKIIQALIENKNAKIEKIQQDMDQLENADTLFEIDKKTEKKILRLIKNSDKPYYKYINTAAKKVAIFIVVLFVAFTTSLITVESFRSEFTEFIVQTYEKFSLIFLANSDDEDTPAVIEKYYEPTWVPEGFEVEFEESDNIKNVVVYSNNDTNIHFIQSLNDSSGYTVNTENTIVEELKIDSIQAMYIRYLDNECSAIVIVHGLYIFSIDASLSKDELIKVASSIKF